MSFSNWITIVTSLCTSAIFSSVLIAFVLARDYPKAEVERKTSIETGTMILFFFLFLFIIKLPFGKVFVPTVELAVMCFVVIIFGTVINVWGRFYLGTNWANQVKIYPNHTLLQTGPYRLVRHPLYASLLWIFSAVSVLYGSWLALLATFTIFYPMMVRRAALEEAVLSKKYPEYSKYKHRVGRFIPKCSLLKST